MLISTMEHISTIGNCVVDGGGTLNGSLRSVCVHVNLNAERDLRMKEGQERGKERANDIQKTFNA